MDARMSAKFDELIQSNAEIKQSYKTVISLLKGFIGGCSLVIVLIVTFMIDTRSDISEIKAILATKDNIATLRDEIRAGDEKLHNEIGGYISLNSYIAIEARRADIVARLLCDLGRTVNVKDEELEKLRTIAIYDLNSAANLGTTRGH